MGDGIVMARAVVLYFEDNEEAEAFIEENPKVALMVAVPTLFCEGGHKKGKFSMSYTRGLKWGWWVCIHCKKPSNVGFAKTLRACLSQGRNLLEDGDKAVSEVTDVGWGAAGRG
jgi:hypothetical protein